MSNKILKNYQVVNVSTPFEFRTPMGCQTTDTTTDKNESAKEDQIQINLKLQEKEILESARGKADLIIYEARLKAENLLEEAKTECSELKKASLQQAREQGFQEGYENAMKQYTKLIREAEQIKEQARMDYSQVMESIEADAVNLVLDIAKKVIGCELSQHPQSILFLVKQAVEKCSCNEEVLLKVSEEDYDFILQEKENLDNLISSSCEIEIKKDSALKAGACILETPYGSIDAGVDTKLANLERAFKELAGNQRQQSAVKIG